MVGGVHDHVGMSNRDWLRRLIMTGVWAASVSTWASIAHHLFGLPDFGPLMVVLTVTLSVIWPARSRRQTDSWPVNPPELVRPSRA